MPFDGTRWAPDTRTAPDLTEPSLAGLAWLLRHPPLWDDKLTFNYGFGLVLAADRFAGDNIPQCGTVGCAIGVAKMVWPSLPMHHSAFDNNWCGGPDFDAIYAILGIPNYVGTDIFYNAGTYGCPWEDVTPVMVADAIDRVLARRA